MDLNGMNVGKLKDVAKDLGVEGFKTMKKKDLIEAIEKVQDDTPVVEPKVETVTKVAVKEEKAEAVPEKKKVRLDRDDYVEIMNNTSGKYGYIGRSGFAVSMSNYGDTVEIPFGELQRMKAEQPTHINNAYIIILNEDAVEQLYLTNLYDNIFTRDEVEYLLSNPDALINALPKMPTSMKETVGSVAIQRLKDGQIYDMRVKKAIEDGLGVTIEV